MAGNGPRVLHIYSSGMMSKEYKILDSDKTTPLYVLEVHSISKPHIVIKSANNATVIGTVTFHTFGSTIDLVVHGRPIPFSKCGIFRSGHEFNSLSNGGAVRKWKKDGVFAGGDMVCLDEKEMPVARFDQTHWAVKKAGKLELNPPVASGVFMDEIIVSGVATMEYNRRQRRSAAAGGGGGGGA